MALADSSFAPDLLVQPGPPLSDDDLPSVTIVILNLNGRGYLEHCLESLYALRYPSDKFDVLVIDNGSDDGSAKQASARWPKARVVMNERNDGFARGCNQGAALNRDRQMLAFVNNDVRVHEDWLRELVQPIVRGECVATGSKMLSWDGSRIDSAGGGMNFHGVGMQHGYNDVPGPVHDLPRRTLFPCGGAMAIRADVFVESGGFDAEFFAYYEDVDLGWRLWVFGHEVHYVPTSICWHRHHGTSDRLPIKAVRLIQVRNPLYACFKNYDDQHLRQVFPVALALLLRRAASVSGIADDPSFRIEQARPHDRSQLPTLFDRVTGRLSGEKPGGYGRSTIGTLAAADLLAADDLLSRWDYWTGRRAEVQGRRRRQDSEIFRLFLRPLWCTEDDPAYRALFAGASDYFGVRDAFGRVEEIAKKPANN